MSTPVNSFKAALNDGHVLRGLWIALGAETTTEIAGQAGFDWCLIDGEHAPFDPTLIRRQLMVLETMGTPAIVRAPADEAWMLKQILDLGAQSVMVPMVETAEQARAIVRACRFPPDGIRGLGGGTTRSGGYGSRPDYPAPARDETCIIVQVESLRALENLAAITAVDGVDCVFIGPADLAGDMGHRDYIEAPELWEAITEAIHTIRAGGKPAGLFGPPKRNAAMVAAGATMLTLGADTAALTAALRAMMVEAS